MASKKDVKPSESKCVVNQRLPKGHFDKDGLSQGQQKEECRPMDAYQGPRTGESK